MFTEQFLYKIKTLKKRGLLPSKFSGPVMISWDITNKCNFNCIFCFNNSGEFKKENLSRNEIRLITKNIIKLRPFWVCICGGEPLLRRELFEVVQLLSKDNIQVSMVSNGWFIDQNKSKLGGGGGGGGVQISLDGCKPETHDLLRGIKGSYFRAIKAIDYLVKEEINVDIAFCPTKLNYKEIGGVVDIAVNLGVKSVRTQPLMILGRGLLNKIFLSLNENEEKEFLLLIKNKQEEYMEDIQITYGNPLVHFYTFRHLPCLFLHITPSGNIKISPYIPIIFGNILKGDIKKLWKELINSWKKKAVLNYIDDIRSVWDFEKKGIVTGLNEDVNIEELENGETSYENYTKIG